MFAAYNAAYNMSNNRGCACMHAIHDGIKTVQDPTKMMDFIGIQLDKMSAKKMREQIHFTRDYASWWRRKVCERVAPMPNVLNAFKSSAMSFAGSM